MKIDWAFQQNEDGSSQGWNDPAIAEFKQNRIESLTRETIQNSLDARDNDIDPVIVKFNESLIVAERIPNIETLKQILTLCKNGEKHENSDLIKELDTAIEISSRARIPVLSVSDYNTKGMAGPCVLGKPFYQYLKAVGQSGGSTGRAGSHGLGKAAPLACSDLRTIFVTANWIENAVMQGLVQGRAVLMSYKKDGFIHKGTGYWGNRDQYQAIQPREVPSDYSWLLRDKVGTTVHIIGWSAMVRTDWEKLIIGYAISNFFAAFMRGRLIIEINNKYTVNSTNIFEMANNPVIHDAMKKNRNLDKITDALFYMRILSEQDQIIREESQVHHLGRTGIKLLVANDAPRKICIIRNDMLITDYIPGFWKRVPGKFEDFVGVVEVIDPEGSKLIRLMEPPSHNSLDIDRCPTIDDKKKGEVALEKLTDELKKFVERYAGSQSDAFGKVDFMADFFADEAGDDRGGKIGDEIDPNGNFRFSPKEIKLPPPSKITLESELDEEIDNEIFQNIPDLDEKNGKDSAVDIPEGDFVGAGGAGQAGGDTPPLGHSGENEGDGIEGVGQLPASDRSIPPKTDRQRDKPSHPIHLSNVRIIKISDNCAKIYATPSAKGIAVLRVHEVGSDYDEPFDILKVDQGTVVKGAVEIALKQNSRFNILVELSREIAGGLKIVASHQVSSGGGKQ